MSKRPADVALLDADARRARRTAEGLRGQGLRTACFGDADALLLSKEPYGFRFFLIDLSLDRHGRLIRLLRRRAPGGILAFGPVDVPAGLRLALSAGADMFLPAELSGEDAALALRAVQRRLAATPETTDWDLQVRACRLKAPDGQVAELSEADVRLLAGFAAAEGRMLTRTALAQVLGCTPDEAAGNLLHAAVYRLRRRVQQSTGHALPLKAVAGAGYAFRGRLTVR